MSTKYISVLGLCTILALAFLFSNNRKHISPRVVFGGLLLQFSLAILILKTQAGSHFFQWAQDLVSGLLALSDKGSSFVFGESFRDHFFAFKVLPMIIFASALTSVCFYWGLIQRVIGGISWAMRSTMGISSVEGLVTAANVFCGQTEAPLFIKPYLKKMTVSEINTMMTGGMATVSGGVLAAFVGFGISAGHLLAASLMSAPAAIILSKMLWPETETPASKGDIKLAEDNESANVIEAACSGASEGLKLALNVAAMLIAFIGLVALANAILGTLGSWVGLELSLQGILGVAFSPIAFLMGVPWSEASLVGGLIGEKLVMNEFIAYIHLGEYMKAGVLSERSVTLSTYALCGFANISSVAIQFGGIGALEPSRKKHFALCGLRALLGGTLATIMSACIAGILV